MTSRTVLRFAVLLVAALVPIDASWCCDELPSDPASQLHSQSAADGYGTSQVDCAECVCSGNVLLVGSSPPAPDAPSSLAVTRAFVLPVSDAGPVEIPPDERA